MDLNEPFTPNSPKFELHMLALGRLCVVSAYVDRLLTDLIQVLLGCTDGQAAIVATENDRAATRCNIIKKLVREASLDEEWRSILDGVLNRLLSLGEKRNRYVHDYWTLASGSLERLDRRARVKKAQAFEAQRLEFDTRHATPPNEVVIVSAEYGVTAVCLLGAIKDLDAWKLEGRLPTPSMLLATDRSRERHPMPTQSPAE